MSQDLVLKPDGIQILERDLTLIQGQGLILEQGLTQIPEQGLIPEALLLDRLQEIIILLREVQQEVVLLLGHLQEVQVRHVEVAADLAHLDEVVTYNRITKKLI